ncbi:ImmA/IrrE family metallo-endopeptidase [Nonomuraea sp. NPDC050663]|uniref:ImmA/IrrE family metallo-endopeptidase n=1 Tax=Nonomuraea sp. NPDC050663 TaxID=3364370 RepID=UPI00379E59AE
MCVLGGPLGGGGAPPRGGGVGGGGRGGGPPPPPPPPPRFTAAHELGHHLLQDVYHTDVSVAASVDDRERIIDAFASALLLPEDAVTAQWQCRGDADVRTRLIAVSGTYRVSWSVAVATAYQLGLIGAAERQSLRAATPVRGDFLAVLGRVPEPDLIIGETGPNWRMAVLAGWRQRRINAARVAELLREPLTDEDLPLREAMPCTP